MPVHSSVVGQSEVLRIALRETKNAGRIQLASPFESTKVPVMDDFLSLVYVYSAAKFPDDLARSREVIELAMRLGLDQAAEKGANNLDKGENLKRFKEELLQKQQDLDFICWWVRIVQLAPGSAAHHEMASFLAKTCHVFSESFAFSVLEQTIKPLLSKEMVLDMMRSLHSGVFSLEFRESTNSRTMYRIPLKLIDQGEVKVHEINTSYRTRDRTGSDRTFQIFLKKV